MGSFQCDKVIHLCLFANPHSGSHEAAKYVKMGKSTEIKLTSKLTAIVNFYNILDADSRNQGYSKLYSLSQQIKAPSDLIVVIAGGDGTLLEMIGRAK